MAPSRTAAPRAKRGPQNLANIGVEGRATGLTVDERPRDENGLEVIENWYSSPAPVDGKKNGMSSSSKDMEIAQSSGPDPIEAMTSGKLSRSSGRSMVPLPRARSPIKTNLGATPMRGTPRTSTSAAKPQTQERTTTKSPRRLLDFSRSENGRSVERSGSLKSDSRRTRNTQDLTNGHVFDLPVSPERGRSPTQTSEPVKDDTAIDGGGEEDSFQDDSIPPPLDDDIPDNQPESEEQEAEQQLILEEAEAAADVINEEEETHLDANGGEGDDDDAGDVGDVGEGETESMPPPPKRRGRPPKNSVRQKDTTAKAKANSSARPAKQARIKPATSSTVVDLRHRTQTPMEDDGSLQTRSGRISFKPVKYWKGERAVFQEHTHNESIQSIIRIPDTPPPKKPGGKPGRPRQARAGSKKRDRSVFEEDQDEDYEEPWEVSEGVVSAPVRMWDADLGVAPVENEVEQQLAFASARIQPRASPDNPNFFFTKTLTMPFFGSGVIEIPPRGFKGLKNSRKFQFIFFVHYGKVNVEVAGTPFTITKGGMWQVPRGNFYSIANETDHPAKIFFAQSCEILVDTSVPPPL